ncbi:hypothetical protein KFE25_001906 [Diacronema lutheri]|uniref:Protein YIPF n=1 Tax=Diacronema lutheri TaxID=2081491 RepID=A0A8J5XVF0_DIALT|nr:hypothetical protein KFE25_001906 [Diacronema lutheri]
MSLRLSADELGSVYGGPAEGGGGEERGGGVGSSASLVDMPAVDDLSVNELNPQSLAFEEISVGAATPVGAGTGRDVSGGTRVSELSSAPYLGNDSAIKSLHMTSPIRSVGASSASLGTAGAASIDAGEAAANANVWQLAYYKPLFDVDSHHILTRGIHALLPRPRAQFFEVIASNPDLYGPFWISTTLIFVIGVSGNLAKWLSFTPTDAQPHWTYDFTKLSGASTAVYMYASGAPVAVWAALRYMQANKRLVDVVCMYGYSLASFVPISLLCVLPSPLLRWILISLGCAASAAFLVSNVDMHLQDCFPYADSDSMRRGYALLGAMGVAHAIFGLVLKVCFF